jgi:hypothetical protein
MPAAIGRAVERAKSPWRIAWAIRLFIATFVVGLTCAPAVSQVRGESSNDAGAGDRAEPLNNGSDITRPQNSFDLRFREVDSSGSDSHTERSFLILQASTKISLDADWKLGVLAQLPLLDKATTSDAGGQTVRDFGVGDTVFQAVLSRPLGDRLAFGFGARLVAPTGDDFLGSGIWRIMPGAGVRYSLPELGPDSYFVPAVRYAMSFAGDPTKRNVSEPQIAPTLNVGLPDRWFVTLYPSYDIRINYGDPISGQTGRLFLPFDVAVGRNLTDSLVASFEISVPMVKDYPVYDFKAELRLIAKF